MKFGFRTPSLKKRLSAKTSLKRYVRHSMGVKAPKGYGFLSNPKKALYNKTYRKTTFGIEDVIKLDTKKNKKITTVDTQTLTPVNNDPNFEICPYSFVQLINSRNKLGKDDFARLILILGFILLFINPLVACGILAGNGYWIYRILKSPWYKVKNKTAKAKTKLKTNKFDDALPLLKEALSFEEENYDLLYMLGVTQFMAGYPEESLVNLKKYTELKPSDLDAKLMLAHNYYTQNQYKKVIPILQQFPKEHPYHLLVILLLGDSFLQLKEYDMAIDVFKSGPLRKRNLNAHLLQLHYLLGMAYKGMGQKAKALKELKRVYAFDINYQDVAQEIESLKNTK